MGIYDTLILPGTRADGEQVKCWFNDLRNIRVGDFVAPIVTVRKLVSDEGIDGGFDETRHRDYVIIMRCDGCLVVRDCKLQGYYLPAVYVPGEPPVQDLPVFDKWGEPWISSEHNCGILGEPYSYRDANIGRSINILARARPPESADQDVP